MRSDTSRLPLVLSVIALGLVGGLLGMFAFGELSGRAGAAATVTRQTEITLLADYDSRLTGTAGEGYGGSAFASAVIDAQRARVPTVADQGHSNSGVFGNALNAGEEWAELIADGAPGSPARRDAFGAAWDPGADALYVFGGRTDSGTSNDLWRWDAQSNTWANLNPTGGPPPARTGCTAVWDTSAGILLVFGGAKQTSGEELLDDLWRYSPATNSWTQLSPSGGPPPSRYSHGAIWDALNSQMLVFGGYGAGVRNDLWSYRPGANTWSEVSPAGSTPPPARTTFGSAWDGSGMVIFGGNPVTGFLLNDLWRYSVTANSWAQLNPSGGLPSARNGPTLVWNPLSGSLLMFGGFNWQSGHLSDLWSYAVTTNAWAQMYPTGGPPLPRAFHEAVWDDANNRMLVFGGYSYSHGLFNDLWAVAIPSGAPVGGVAELPEVGEPSSRNDVPLPALAAAALFTLTAGAWYARRRWTG